MKRTNKLISMLVLMFVFAFTLAVFCGCDNNNGENEIEYLAFEVGGYDEMDGGKHASEYDIWSNSNRNYHTDPNAAPEATITFQGVTYSGVYKRTAVWMPDLYPSHKYKTEDNIYFSINGDTGEVVSIKIPNNLSKESTVDTDYCKKIADSVADDYIDLEKYKSSMNVNYYDGNFIAQFEYYREINGYRTSERLSVSVDGNGKIVSFGHSMLHAFDGVDSVKIDKEKADIALDNKINSIYKDSSAEISGYDIESVKLVKLEDGSYGLLYTVCIEFKAGNGTFSTLTDILLAPQ